MKTAVETLTAVLEIGGNLSPAGGGRLRAMLPPDCPAEVREAIGVHKTSLLVLLSLLSSSQFIVVRSEVLQPRFLLWIATDCDRHLLISLGAPPGVVYTRDELCVIVERTLDANTLMILHQCKRIFGGTILSHCSD